MEYGPPDAFVCESDLGWDSDVREYFAAVVNKDGVHMGYRYPFATAIDRRGMTLEQRMAERMSAGAQEYPVYNGLAVWEGAAYAATVTTGNWGRYGRQFLGLEPRCTYVRICQSEGWCM